MPALDSLTFNTSALEPGNQEPERKIWFTRDGDGISLNFFAKPPDLPNGARSVNELREFYQERLKGTGAKLVSLTTATVAQCRAIQLIIKAPQRPSGQTYVGSLTLPFRDFSFVLKSQCEERGTTGVREAVLFDKLMKAGVVKFDPAKGFVGDWDPDNERYDAEFPQHPLSRLRVILRNMEQSAAFESSASQSAPFPLP